MSKATISFPGFRDVDHHMTLYFEAEAHIRKIEHILDIKIHQLKERHLADLQIWKNQQRQAYTQLHAFARQNALLFKANRTLQFTYGVMGFKKGFRQIVKKKGFSWMRVLRQLKQLNLPFVRTTEDVHIDKLKKARLSQSMIAKLGEAGLHIEPAKEEFFVETKRLKLKPRP